MNTPKAVILVGHGAVAKGTPRDLVARLKALEGERQAHGGKPTAEELEIDHKVRRWPRTPATDPYQAGLEALAAELRPLLADARVVVAYNEFCAPTLAEAVEDVVRDGAAHVRVISSMLTPGGVHSETEIPEIMAELRRLHPAVKLDYAWPFDLKLFAGALSEQLARFG